MRFGFVASYGDVALALQLAEEAEAHGWDGFFTWDGIAVGPFDTWDPWALLAAAAVRTSRVRLGALVFPLARRRPWKVAREALTVDHLSGGRLVLPVGLGVDEDGGFSRVSGEARTPRERAERLDEALAILAAAWTGEPFSHDGTHYRVEGLQITPRPVQRPRVPVWPVTAVGRERSMARAARWDGAVLQGAGTQGEPSAAEVAGTVAWLHERRAALAARGAVVPDAFDVVQHGELPADRGAALDHVRELEAAGATWYVQALWEPARATPEALLAAVRQGPPR